MAEETTTGALRAADGLHRAQELIDEAQGFLLDAGKKEFRSSLGVHPYDETKASLLPLVRAEVALRELGGAT